MFSQKRIEQIASTLAEAGDDWQDAAARIEAIEAAHPGDAHKRDHVTLHRTWGMEVNKGLDIAECPAIMYRLEDGTWRGMGWSDASQALLYRPEGTVFDEDAGVYVTGD